MAAVELVMNPEPESVIGVSADATGTELGVTLPRVGAGFEGGGGGGEVVGPPPHPAMKHEANSESPRSPRWREDITSSGPRKVEVSLGSAWKLGKEGHGNGQVIYLYLVIVELRDHSARPKLTKQKRGHDNKDSCPMQ